MGPSGACCSLSLVLVLFPFVPEWSLDLVHCLLCLGLLMDPATSICPCLLCADLVRLCSVTEGTACAGIAFGSWLACILGAAGQYLLPDKYSEAKPALM